MDKLLGGQRLQTIPDIGFDDTGTPEGLNEFLNRAPFTHSVASRIVNLGPLALKFVFNVGGTYGHGGLSGWDWEVDDAPFGEETIEGVPPYWELVFNGAKEVGDTTWGDIDFPEKLDQAIQNSTRGELYRVGLRDALDEAESSLRNSWRYRHYRLRRGFGSRLTGSDLGYAWRAVRAHAGRAIIAIRTLRELLVAAGGPYVLPEDRPAIELD